MQKQKKVVDIFQPKTSVIFPKGKPQPIPERISQPVLPTKEKKGRIKGKLLGFILLLLIPVFCFLYFALGKAEIEIWPETETFNLDEKVTVDVKTNRLSFSAKTIPGKVFEEQKSASQQFSSSGKKLKEKNAEGTIRVYNNYHLSQTLVERTRFQPPLEKVLYFRSIETVSVPAKDYLDVRVKADRPGEEYNIGPSTFAIPGLGGLPQYYSISGKSFSSMSGGFKGEVNQVSQEDLDGAKETLLKQLEKEIKDYFKSKLAEDFILLDESISQEITEASSSLTAGSEADSFDFNLKMKLKAITFRKSDLENYTREIINSNIKGADKKIQNESLNISYSPESINRESGEITLNLKISAKIYSDIELTSLKKNLVGKSLKETQWLLSSQPQITKVKVKLWPFWTKKIPENLEKIKLRLNIE